MKLEEVASVLNEYGEAIRGDWGSIDERPTINTFAEAMLHPDKCSVERLRLAADICPHGHGHWTQYCDKYCGDDD